jgi:hypothetical protein
VSCVAVSLILAPHLLYDSDLFHKQAASLAGKPGAPPRHGQILTWAAACDNVHRRQLRAVQLCNVPEPAHLRESQFCHFDGKGFDFACQQRGDAVADRRQREASDSIKQASQRWHQRITVSIPPDGETAVFMPITFSFISVISPPPV